MVLSRFVVSAPALMVGMTLQAQAVPNVQVLMSPEVHIRKNNITINEVIGAQRSWCQGLLKISTAYASGGFAKAKNTAEGVIDQNYGYQFGPVAFKPTLASGQQTFRPTRTGALAYFIGGDAEFPNDKGFARNPWRSCVVVNQVIQLSGRYATTMGNVSFTNPAGQITTVDKTWSFMKETNGAVRIVLHHSSLAYTE